MVIWDSDDSAADRALRPASNARSEVSKDAAPITFGLAGRQKRGADAAALEVVHVHRP